MKPELLRTLAKFAGAPTELANKVLGSTAYGLGAGDVSNIPASAVIKHSILPTLIGSGVGLGLGTLGGMLASRGLESANIIAPADPTGSAAHTITDAGGAVSGLEHRPEPTSYFGQSTSDIIRSKAPVVGAFIGTGLGQSLMAKPTFMSGIRDARSSDPATEPRKPWDDTKDGPWIQGVANTHVPWSDRTASNG